MRASLRSFVALLVCAVVGSCLLATAADAKNANLSISPNGAPGAVVIRGGEAYNVFPAGTEKVVLSVTNAGWVASEKSTTSLVATAVSGADEGSRSSAQEDEGGQVG